MGLDVILGPEQYITANSHVLPAGVESHRGTVGLEPTKSFFESIQEDQCPREMFVRDLLAEVVKWLETGDQLVIGGDVNEDVRTCGLSQSLKELGLIEILTETHGLNGPSTYNRGSAPIDGIFVSPTLQGIRCGYNKFVWDHRLLWIDIPMTVAFGHNAPPIARAAARRLKCEDPRIVKKYLEEYKVWINHFGLLAKAQRLQEIARNLPEERLKSKNDDLDKIRFEAMMFADKHCRKLKMGAKQWSPDYRLARDKVTLWELVVQLRQGKRIHKRYVQRLMSKCDEQGALSATLEEALENGKSAYRYEKIWQNQRRLPENHG
jgi:hypothetical protein